MEEEKKCKERKMERKRKYRRWGERENRGNVREG